MMQGSSALLLLNYETLARYIPGKLYEYLAAGPPILVYGDTGEVARLIRRLNAGILVPHGDVYALERALDKIKDTDHSKNRKARISEWLDLHTRQKMSQRMIELLEKLLISP